MAKTQDVIAVSGLSPIREMVKQTPSGQVLSFSAWLRVAAAERIAREGMKPTTKEKVT